MKRARIVTGIILALLLELLALMPNNGAASGHVNLVGVSNDKTLIHPLPGQYANYSIENYENGTMTWSGRWNSSYLDYIEPDLINVTHTIVTEGLGGSSGPQNGVFWLTVNTTNRWVVDGSHWWRESWYAFWIGTDVGEGSVVRIWTADATVMRSEIVVLDGRLVDCWVINYTEYYDTKNLVFFDKMTGLCVGWHTTSEYPFQRSVILALVSTNIPIGIYSASHEMGISLEVPANLQPGESTPVNATVCNFGVNNETNVKVQLFIDEVLANSTQVPFVANGSSVKLTYMWTPASESIYNITAYVNPVPGETFTENNRVTALVKVPTTPKLEVGVKTGDWIKYDYVITGQPQGTVLPQWFKIEFLTVEGTSASVLAVLHLSNGTEQNQTMIIDIGSGGETLVTFSGIVIPSNLTVGDSVYMSGYGYVTIEREYEKTYAGMTREVLSTGFSQQGISLTYYWDKQTGVLVEADSSFPQANMTAIVKATETNMWQANTIIRLAPSEMSVSLGTTFTLGVAITDAADMYTWQIELFFDPEVLNCTSAWYPDEHVFSGKEIVTVNPVIDNNEGYVLYGCCLLGDEETFNGNGTLCLIQFTAVSSGKTAISFSGPEDTFLLDSQLDDIPLGTYGANLQVDGLYCDLNNDGRVDIADISAAAQAFCSNARHPRWNPAADINRDGTVNILDLVLIARSFA